MPKLMGIDVDMDFYEDYMRNIFGESFAHCSLSIEKAFERSKNAQKDLDIFASKENIKYYEYLREHNPSLLKQRLDEVMQVLRASYIDDVGGYDSEGLYVPGISDFSKYLPGAVRPYRNIPEYNQAKMNGCLTGEDYEAETVLGKSRELAEIIRTKVCADRDAYNMKKGNNEAFIYSVEAGVPLTATIIKNINSYVNNESGIATGFKKVNNQITGASFNTCDRLMVPQEIQRLLYLYHGEWAHEIMPLEDCHNDEDKKKRALEICIREAKFHIQFERIHPFEDGNGRTGRIIINKNLIDNGLAPVLITGEFRDEYLKCIEGYDFNKLGEFIFQITSVTGPMIVAEYRRKIGMSPDAVNDLGLTPTEGKKHVFIPPTNHHI